MEELLKQIAINTEPSRSFSIMVSDYTTRFKTWFKPPIELSKETNYEIALVNLETYYSFLNIEKTNNHFRYSSDGRQWINMLTPEVSNKVEDSNEFIQLKISENNHKEALTIFANTNTLNAEMILKENYHVDFRPPNSISSILGFSNKLYKSKFQESENTVNILNINSI